MTINPTTGAVEGSVNHDFGSSMDWSRSALQCMTLSFKQGPQFPSSLVIVEPTNGNLTTVGSTGLGPISELAWNVDSGVIVVKGAVGQQTSEELRKLPQDKLRLDNSKERLDNKQTQIIT